MNQRLTEEIAYKALQEFFTGRNIFVLFGTGTSCGVDIGFGMNALKEHLIKDILLDKLDSIQQTEWNLVLDHLHNGNDLESAMNYVQDEKLTQDIIKSTAKLVSALDRKYSSKIFYGEISWPAARLFQLLVEGLSESSPMLHVATPNYDLLAEHAFEKMGINYITGFYGGVCRKRDWKRAGRSFIYINKYPYRRSIKLGEKCEKHIRLYKVHGSLNTFKLNNVIVENNSWIYDCPNDIERLMITPGIAKFQRLHQNRADLLREFDDAIESHNAFLFMGFGFNDSQLCNDSIKRKLKEQKCWGLIITRDNNFRIEEYMRECENLWLVCKNPNNGNQGTCIYNVRYGNHIELNNKRLWDPGEFTNEILGG